MRKNRALLFDGDKFSEVIIDAPSLLRWVCWRDDELIMVGNNGCVIIYTLSGKVRQINSGTDENLRCIDISKDGDTAIIVGNKGTILMMRDEELSKVDSATDSNLRRVAWSDDGSYALAVGNEGAALLIHRGRVMSVESEGNNLRSVSWHRDGYAIVVGNTARATIGGMIPASGFYRFDPIKLQLTPIARLNEPRTPEDLTSVSWRPDWSYCVIVGYDQVWSTPSLYKYDGSSIVKIEWKGEDVYPTGFAWHPSGKFGNIVTGGPKLGSGRGMVFKFDGSSPSLIYDWKENHIGCISWSKDGKYALIIGDPEIRSFSV